MAHRERRSRLFSESSDEEDNDSDTTDFKRRKRNNSHSSEASLSPNNEKALSRHASSRNIDRTCALNGNPTSRSFSIDSGVEQNRMGKPLDRRLSEGSGFTHVSTVLTNKNSSGFIQSKFKKSPDMYTATKPYDQYNQFSSTSVPQADAATLSNRQCKPIIETRNTTSALFDSPIKITSNSKALVNDPFEFFKKRQVSSVHTLLQTKVSPSELQNQLAVQKKLETRLEFQLSHAKSMDEDRIDGRGTTASSSDDAGGTISTDSDATPVVWDILTEDIKMAETVHWIVPEVAKPLDLSVLITWRKLGKKDTSLCRAPDVYNFISPNLKMQLMDLKDEISDLEENGLLGARVRSNAFETIRSSIFMNRAAVKLANLDAVLQFHLTNPKTKTGQNFVSSNDLFYFADVCAGPGGFSEYILWRKGWEAKGFGFTLKECDCDFNLPEFIAGTPESFEVNYGEQGDGNVLNPVNVSSFIKFVLNNTEGQGVHLMLADGGFEVEDKHLQEEMSKSIYLAQILVALGIVRTGGNFVCKVFDVMTKCSVGLIYLLYNCFELVSIHKPHTSRPANAERYIICKWKRENSYVDGIFKYLADCHKILWTYANEKIGPGGSYQDILDLVPIELLAQKDTEFYKYIRMSNDIMATNQIMALQKTKTFYANPALIEHRQGECRQYCLDKFKLPDMKRPKLGSKKETPGERFNLIRQKYPAGLFLTSEIELTTRTMIERFKSPYDWRCMVIAAQEKTKQRGFYFSLGRNRVFRFEQYIWRDVAYPMEFSRDTLVYGEIVFEVSRITYTQRPVFHIIDALILGGKDMRNLHFVERHGLCAKFAKSMNKTSNTQSIPVRVKPLIRLEQISGLFEKLTYHQLQPPSKSSPGSSLLCPSDIDNDYADLIQPAGILFMKITKEPWLMALSRSSGCKYWFNALTRASSFSCPETAVADFQHALENRVAWLWDTNTRLSVVNCLTDVIPINANAQDKVHASQIIRHVESFLSHVQTPN